MPCVVPARPFARPRHPLAHRCPRELPVRGGRDIDGDTEGQRQPVGRAGACHRRFSARTRAARLLAQRRGRAFVRMQNAGVDERGASLHIMSEPPSSASRIMSASAGMQATLSITQSNVPLAALRTAPRSASTCSTPGTSTARLPRESTRRHRLRPAGSAPVGGRSDRNRRSPGWPRATFLSIALQGPPSEAAVAAWVPDRPRSGAFRMLCGLQRDVQ